MRFLLDTNILSEPRRQFPYRAARRQPYADVLAKLQEHRMGSAIAAATWHELKYGCDRMPPSKRQRQLASYIETLN